MSGIFTDIDREVLIDRGILSGEFHWDQPIKVLDAAVDRTLTSGYGSGPQPPEVTLALTHLEATRATLRLLLLGSLQPTALMKVDLTHEQAILDKGIEILNARQKAESKAIGYFDFMQDHLTRAMIKDDNLRERVVAFTLFLANPHSAKEIMNEVRRTFPKPDPALPLELNLGIRLAHNLSMADRLLAPVVKMLVGRAIGRYVVAENLEQAFYNSGIDDLAKGISPIFDILGESIKTQDQANAFIGQYLDFIKIAETHHIKNPGFFEKIRSTRKTAPYYSDKLHADVQIAIKFSMLTPLWDKNENPSATKDAVKAAMRPILLAIKAAREKGLVIALRVDPEHYRYNDMLYEIFCDLLMEDDFKHLSHIGVGVQAYLKDSELTIQHLAAIAFQRGTPITIGLVKGAYHQHEIDEAKKEGRPIPVFEAPWKTNYHYERMAAYILKNDNLFLQAGTHNPRQQAATLALATIHEKPVEIGMLEGLDMPGHKAHQELKNPFAPYQGTGTDDNAGPYMGRRFVEITKEGGIIRTLLLGKTDTTEMMQHPATDKVGDDIRSYANDILQFATWKRGQRKEKRLEGTASGAPTINRRPAPVVSIVETDDDVELLPEIEEDDIDTEEMEIDLGEPETIYQPVFKDNLLYNQIPGWRVLMPQTLAAMNSGLLNSAMAFATR